MRIIFHEDNQAMICVCKTGKNPTMRHVGRTHKVDIAWLHERFQETAFELIYETTDKQAADIFTKGFTDIVKWRHACSLISHIYPDQFWAAPEPTGGLKRKFAAVPAPICWGPASTDPKKSIESNLKQVTWTRHDNKAYTFKPTTGNGPPLSVVNRRTTIDHDTNEVIDDDVVFQEHGKTHTGRLIPGAPRNIRTVFYYTPHFGEDPVFATALRSNCAGSVGHADTSLRAGTIEFDPVSASSVGPANSAGAKRRKRIIFEWCCGEESKLGIHTEWSEGCEVIRITIGNDVTTKEGLAWVIAQVKNHEHDEILLWGSILCTGGLSGQG